jgi:hypothetical protein
LRAAFRRDGVGRVLCAAAIAVAAFVRDRVEGVSDRHDAGGERDAPAAQPARVA